MAVPLRYFLLPSPPVVVQAWCLLLVCALQLGSASGAVARAVARAGRGASAAVRSSKAGWWPFDEDIAHSGDDIAPVSGWLGDTFGSVQAPGDMNERDEMLPQPTAPPRRPRPRAALAAVGKKYTPKTANFVSSTISGVTNPDLVWNLRPPSIVEMDAGRPPEKVVDEYDVDLHPEFDEQQRRRGGAPVVHPEELPTREDKERVNYGDVEHVRAPPPPHPPRRRSRSRRRRPRLMAAQQHRRVAVGAEHAKETPAGAQMMTQCIGYAMWLKSQNATGSVLIGLWKKTCMQGSGVGAPEQYRIMCDSLVGAVSEFADDPNWTPHTACEDVLRVFRESGVGGSPLKGL